MAMRRAPTSGRVVSVRIRLHVSSGYGRLRARLRPDRWTTPHDRHTPSWTESWTISAMQFMQVCIMFIGLSVSIKFELHIWQCPIQVK